VDRNAEFIDRTLILTFTLNNQYECCVSDSGVHVAQKLPHYFSKFLNSLCINSPVHVGDFVIGKNLLLEIRTEISSRINSLNEAADVDYVRWAKNRASRAGLRTICFAAAARTVPLVRCQTNTGHSGDRDRTIAQL
jgi:hypothetical protein